MKKVIAILLLKFAERMQSWALRLGYEPKEVGLFVEDENEEAYYQYTEETTWIVVFAEGGKLKLVGDFGSSNSVIRKMNRQHISANESIVMTVAQLVSIISKYYAKKGVAVAYNFDSSRHAGD